MKRTIIEVSLLLAVGLSIGCNRAKDEVLPDGTKVFGERTLWGGNQKTERIESPDGKKDFDVTRLKDGTLKAGRREFPDGQKYIDLTWLKDGTQKIGRSESTNGAKAFDLTFLPDGTKKIGRAELPNGEKHFDVTQMPDRTVKIERAEYPNGEKHFDKTILPDHTQKIGRVEFPDGAKKFDVTLLPDGTEIMRRATKSDGTEIPTFSNVQNDQQGYADVRWGTAITDLDPNAAGESGQCFFSDGSNFSSNSGEGAGAVAAAFGVPTQQTVVAGTVIETYLDSTVVPAKCKSIVKGDVRFISYDDRFAMAFTHLDAHNYESIASEMASKFTEMDGWSVKWGGGAASDGDSTSINVRLFKRGSTNTRVFLLKRTDHGGIGMNVSSAYLLYVPNVDYLRIREDMRTVKRDREAQTVAEQKKREQPDLQKIQ